MPLLLAIFTALAEPHEDNDEEEKRTRRLLQRNYYLFITTIVSNNLLDVMAALDSAILQQVGMGIGQKRLHVPRYLSSVITNILGR